MSESAATSEDSKKKQGRTAKVKSLVTLAPGVEFELRDWQIACSADSGSMVIANLDIEESKEENAEYEIQKGVWRITPKQGLQKVNFLNSVYYATETSVRLGNIFQTFKKNIHVYEELGIKAKKRGVLLGSVPGVGKSALINNFCQNLTKETDACVLYIDNSNVDYELVQTMFRRAKLEDASFIVLVIEDIGGSDLEEQTHHIDSTLLNFLDGQEGIFKIPTLVIGTTNYLDLLQDSITSRPGRFDIVLQVQPPSDEESIKFVQDFMKRDLTDSEKKAIVGKKFTPAYLRESVIRHRLDEIPFEEAVKALFDQRKLSESKSHKSGRLAADLGF